MTEHKPLSWKKIDGFGEKYEVSNCGIVRSMLIINRNVRRLRDTPKTLKPSLYRRYLRVSLCKDGAQKLYSIHRLVLSAFDRKSHVGEYACHRNGISTDNRIENLYWGSPEDNMADCLKHGTRARGVTHGSSKLSDADVLEIRKLHSLGISNDVLADKFKVAKETIGHIYRRETWKHLSD